MKGLVDRKTLYKAVQRPQAAGTPDGTPGASIFSRKRDDPSKTYFINGRSFSGKTHFVVQELNALAKEHQCCKMPYKIRPVYDLILFMTDSVDADPLRGLDPSVPLLMIRGYYPRLVLLLKKIQDKTNRAFRFLVILDDIVHGIREGTAKKQILTLRNSHISTCIVSQYSKLISPAMRNSMHEWYITGLKDEDYEYLLRGFLSSHAREAVGNIRSMSQLSHDFKDFVGNDILFYSQRTDKMGLIRRDHKWE